MGRAWTWLATATANVRKRTSVPNNAADHARLWVREAAKDEAAVAIPQLISRYSRNIRVDCLLRCGATSPIGAHRAPGDLRRESRKLLIWGQLP